MMRFRSTVLLFVLPSFFYCRSRSFNQLDEAKRNSENLKAVKGGVWTPLVTLKDRSNAFPGNHEIPRPDGGWWVSPIHANLLADGRVLITGWSRPKQQSCEDHQGRLNGTTFVLDPKNLDSISASAEKTLFIEPLDEMPQIKGDVLYCAGHAPMPDGKILFTGGARYKNLGNVEYPDPFLQKEYGLPYSRVFDPQTTSFSVVKEHNPGDPKPFDGNHWSNEPGGGYNYEPGMMWYPTNTRLPGGKILTNGGYSRWIAVTDNRKWDYLNKSVTIFDSANFQIGKNPWMLWVPHHMSPREVGIDVFDYPRSFVLPQPVIVEGIPRHVAIFGGLGWDPNDPSYVPGFTFLSLDPSVPPEMRFASTPNSRRPQGGLLHETTSAILPSGEILIMGGGKDADRDGQRIDIYNPFIDRWRISIETGTTRQKPSATLLPNSSVLIVGGEESYQSGKNLGDRRQPTIFDINSNQISTLEPWENDPEMRGYHNISILLKDARVLIGGGRVYANATEGLYRIGCERPELRIFSPPYLFNGPRPEIKAFVEPLLVQAGGPPFEVEFSGPAPRIEGAGVVLMALGAFTHSFDQNQRQVNLEFRFVREGVLEIMPPQNTLQAPEGEYNLFLISKAGVPSLGKTVRIK
jgi:hypothetical protein